MKAARHALEFACWVWLLLTTPPDHPEQPDPEMNKKMKSLLEFTWLKWLWTMKTEIVAFGIAFFLFFAAIPWLRELDPTAAGLDAGVLSFPVVGVVAVVAAVILFFAIVRLIVPYVDKWFDGDLKNEYSPAFRINFEEDWRNAAPAVRLGIFFGLLVAVILAVAIVTAAAF